MRFHSNKASTHVNVYCDIGNCKSFALNLLNDENADVTYKLSEEDWHSYVQIMHPISMEESTFVDICPKCWGDGSVKDPTKQPSKGGLL